MAVSHLGVPGLNSRTVLALMAVMLLTAASSQAQYVPRPAAKPAPSDIATRTSRSLATLVYDAKLREVLCWSEGALAEDFRQHLCDPAHGWHPVTANIYFVRGQSITLVLQNAVASDIFTLDIKADDLAEPQVPVSGALTELPKLQTIPAPPTVLPGVGTTFVAGAAPVRASTLYRLAITSEEKDFKAWLQANLLDPLGSKEVLDLLAVDIDAAIVQAQAADALLPQMTALKTDLEAITDAPLTMDLWIQAVRALVGLIDRDSALRSRLVLQGITAAGASINSAFLSTRSVPVQRALALDPADLLLFANALNTGLGETPYAKIAAIGVSGKHFSSGDPAMGPIVEGLNNALGAQDATSVLARAKTNLNALADSNPQIQLADTRRQVLASVKTKVDDQRSSATTGVYALQTTWTATADLMVKKAAALNGAGKTLPLDARFDTIPVGQWFSSKTVTLTVKQGQRVALFDVGGVSDATRAGIVAGDVPATKGTQTAAADLAAARVIQFPVYNLYRFKIGLGFLYSTGDDKVYKVDKVTTGSGATAVVEQFIDQTRDRDYTLLPSVNVMIFPWARHAFPSRPRFEGEPAPRFYTDLAAMFGFSATNPTRDFLIGGAWFPRMSPVGVQVAWHLALRDYPGPGTDVTQPVADRVIALHQQRVNGVSAGLVFTTDFFTKVFAPIFKP